MIDPWILQISLFPLKFTSKLPVVLACVTEIPNKCVRKGESVLARVKAKARARLCYHSLSTFGFLAGKKSLQKSQMMDPVALLLASILLGIFCSFQTSWNSMARAGSRGN